MVQLNGPDDLFFVGATCPAGERLIARVVCADGGKTHVVTPKIYNKLLHNLPDGVRVRGNNSVTYTEEEANLTYNSVKAQEEVKHAANAEAAFYEDILEKAFADKDADTILEIHAKIGCPVNRSFIIHRLNYTKGYNKETQSFDK